MQDPVDTAYDKSNYNKDGKVIKYKDLCIEIENQLNNMLADGDVLTDVILEEFSYHDMCNFGNALANLLNCLPDKRTEHIDVLLNLFKFRLNECASEKAFDKLESESL